MTLPPSCVFPREVDDGMNPERDSPLWSAAFHGHANVALFLLSRGADPIAVNAAGYSVLDVIRWVRV